MVEGKPGKARRFELIEELYQRNEWNTADLAKRFGITPNLLANDLKTLEALGLVVRTRGRARWSPLSIGDLFGNTMFQRQWNDRVARALMETVAEFIAKEFIVQGSVFLDEGVVPALVAKCLAQRGLAGVNIVTTNLGIPIVFAQLGTLLPCDLLPGRLAHDYMCVVPSSDGAAVGEGFAPSVAVIVPHAVSADGDLYVADWLFSPVKERMMRAAGKVVLAVEASRIGQPGGFLLARADELRDQVVERAHLVTDSRLAGTQASAQLQELWGERLVVVPDRPTALHQGER